MMKPPYGGFSHFSSSCIGFFRRLLSGRSWVRSGSPQESRKRLRPAFVPLTDSVWPVSGFRRVRALMWVPLPFLVII